MPTCIALLILLLALEAALPLYQRLYALFPQTTVLALGILLLLQFAYRFPTAWPHRWETYLVLALSLLYLGYEGLFAVHRFRLLAQGVAIYRINWADYPMVAGLLWAPIVLLRQAMAVSRTTNAAGENAAEHPFGELRAGSERRAAARSRRMRSSRLARPHPSTPSRVPRRDFAQDAPKSFSEQIRGVSCAACSAPRVRRRAPRGRWRWSISCPSASSC